MHQRPGRPVIMMPTTQQKTRELLARLPSGANCGQTGMDQITDGLVRRIGNPDGGQFTGSVQLGEVDRIPPIGLDPVAGLARDQRWSNDPCPDATNCRWIP